MPDPDGSYFRTVQAALNHPSCAHIKGFFWDYASLYQNQRSAKRTSKQNQSFARALAVMANVYASVLGTTVLRHEPVPPMPSGMGFEGTVCVVNVLAGTKEEALVKVLGAHGTVVKCNEVDSGWVAAPGMPGDPASWEVTYSTHAEAEAAAATGVLRELPSHSGGGAPLFVKYNARPYFERGWPRFETAVSEEGLARAKFQSKLSIALDSLPPKMLDIGGTHGVPRLVRIKKAEEGTGPRIEAVIKGIQEAKFTGKGDEANVIKLYRDFQKKIDAALSSTGIGKISREWKGEWDEKHRAHGIGIEKLADGTIYEGEMAHGAYEGRGTQRKPNGERYVGEWVK